jgi:stearoyl-CoA desaturase (delta-9 desaturase)
MKVEPAVGVLVGAREARRRAISYAVVLSLVSAGGLWALYWIAQNGLGWIEVSCFLIFYVMASIGQGIGLHRYFSHKSFKTSRPVRLVLAALATMSMQGSIIGWVADHRRHHAHTDDCGDLHSPHVDDHCRPVQGLRGLLHAQLGWLFADTYSDPRIFAKDLLNDPVVAFFGRTRLAWYFLSIVALPALYGYALGGSESVLGAILVGGALRAIVFSQSILALNSIGHTIGEQRFEQANSSRNNMLLAVLTLGEGWHNNHHRFPRNAYAGLAWYEIDPLGSMIGLGEKLGIFWDVVRVGGVTAFERTQKDARLQELADEAAEPIRVG